MNNILVNVLDYIAYIIQNYSAAEKEHMSNSEAPLSIKVAVNLTSSHASLTWLVARLVVYLQQMKPSNSAGRSDQVVAVVPSSALPIDLWQHLRQSIVLHEIF